MSVVVPPQVMVTSVHFSQEICLCLDVGNNRHTCAETDTLRNCFRGEVCVCGPPDRPCLWTAREETLGRSKQGRRGLYKKLHFRMFIKQLHPEFVMLCFYHNGHFYSVMIKNCPRVINKSFLGWLNWMCCHWVFGRSCCRKCGTKWPWCWRLCSCTHEPVRPSRSQSSFMFCLWASNPTDICAIEV